MLSRQFVAAQTDPVVLALAFLNDRDFCEEVLTSDTAALRNVARCRRDGSNARFLWLEAFESARWWINGQAEIDLSGHLAAMDPCPNHDAPF